MFTELHQGDCLEIAEHLKDDSVDMVLCDPPYSSGGLYSGDRKRETRDKYFDKNFEGGASFKSFSGDNMDQRSFTKFMRAVLMRCRQKTKPGGLCAVFIDWRNLPALTDALQMAGWVWRGVVVWDKGQSRPIPDRYRNDCEYIVWGTNGSRKAEFKPGSSSGAGCYHIPIVPARKKQHQTEKPLELVEKLLEICPASGTVLDPFMGSGTTGVAYVRTGRSFIGIELDPDYFKTAERRIKEASE